MGVKSGVKQKVYEALPQDYLLEAPFINGKVTPEGKSHRQRASWWSDQSDAYLMLALSPDEIELDIKTIKKLAKAAGVKLDPANDDYPEDQQLAISDELCRSVNSDEYSKLLDLKWQEPGEEQGEDLEGHDEPISEDELWEESERIAQPISLLKARKTKSTTAKPVATWNSRLSSKWEAGAWIRVDLRQHPNPRLQADGVLTVWVDHRNGNSEASFSKNTKLKPAKNEKVLYAETDIDYPEQSVLEIKAAKKIRSMIDESPEAIGEYDATWWDEAHPRDMLSQTNVYAQLGGWPISWPEESAESRIKSQLVLRTYQDSEPWIEVFRTGRKYEVFERIT